MAYYQKNMLSIKSRTFLANILAEVVLISESLQLYREALAKVQHFDCIALFRYLDREEKGYLRQKDFQRAIGTSHRKLLTYAFSWFDNMKVGEISRLEFAAFLLPKQNLDLRQLVAKRVENPQSIALQNQSIMLQFDLFSKLVVEIMNREMRIIELRRQLVKNEDYSIKGVLSAIDGNKHQWICAEDLLQFLKNFGFDVNLRQVQKLVQVMNNTIDGKITEDQLRWTVEGFQTKNKAYLGKIKDSNHKQANKASSSLQKDYLDNTIPTPSVRQFNSEDTSDLQLKTKYNKLLQSYHMFDEQHKKIDELLKNEAQEIENQFDNQCRKFIAEIRQRKEIQLNQLQINLARQQELRHRQQVEYNQEIYLVQQRQREYQQFLKEKQQLLRKQKELQQLQELNLRTAYIKELAQKRLGYSNTFYLNTPPQIRYSPNKYATMYSPHSPQKQFESPMRKKDYTNLSRLSKLTQVESFRRPTERSSYQPSSIAERSTALQEANNLREIIKRQREIERQIKSQFTSGKFNGSKYSSRNTSVYASKKINQNSEQRDKTEQKYQSPLKDSPKFKDTGINQFTKSTNKPSETKT